jgi:hypothetical protein
MLKNKPEERMSACLRITLAKPGIQSSSVLNRPPFGDT